VFDFLKAQSASSIIYRYYSAAFSQEYFSFAKARKYCDMRKDALGLSHHSTEENLIEDFTAGG
jgi:hypothetical protein